MRLVSKSIACGLLLAAAPSLAQQTPGTPDLPATIQPDEDEQRTYEASVIERTQLRNQGDGVNDLSVHLYGTAGGDPAMNGLYTYIAFYQFPGEGHRVFRIGDFNNYRVVSERKGQVLLQVQENTIGEASGEIGNRTRRIRVSWTPSTDETPPATIRVTAAP